MLYLVASVMLLLLDIVILIIIKKRSSFRLKGAAILSGILFLIILYLWNYDALVWLKKYNDKCMHPTESESE